MKADFKCNNCNEEIDIGDHELYDLYDTDEDLHKIDCPYCDSIIYVKPIINFDFQVCDKEGDEII